jgi:hypothetical protein
MAIVALTEQRITLYDANGGALSAHVSSGQTDYETPVGLFTVLEKEEEHYSNLYDDASMPYMQRITWSGIALHAGPLPGYPASHGCVRLPDEFARRIYGLTRLGMRVVVARDDVAPVPVSHPLLMKPAPVEEEAVARAVPTVYTPEGGNVARSALLPDVSAWPARQRQLESLKAVAAEKAAEARAASKRAEAPAALVKEQAAEHKKALKAQRAAEGAKRKAEERVARVEKSLAAAKKPEAIKAAEEAKAKALALLATADAQLAAANKKARAAAEALAKATEAANSAEAEKTAAVKAAKEAEHRMLPVSVFVSLKTQRLYVRQGFEPVLDTPVTIRDPGQPIGTHLFTALHYTDGGNAVRWNVVSLVHRNDRPEEVGTAKSRKGHNAEAMVTDPAPAIAALERVTIPPEVLARVSEFVWPGSSLIISDEEMHKETGKATDFIVVISGEPQGALKKRRRPPDNFYRFDPYDPFDPYYGYRPRRMPRYRIPPPFADWW